MLNSPINKILLVWLQQSKTKGLFLGHLIQVYVTFPMECGIWKKSYKLNYLDVRINSKDYIPLILQ